MIEDPNINSDRIGPRTLKVQTRHGESFTTPTKPITHKELRSRADVPHLKGVTPGDISILPMYIMKDVFKEYRRCNGTVNEIYEKISMLSESVSFMYNLPTLQIDPIKPDSPEAIVTLIKQVGIPTLSGVCMPLLETDYEGFRRTLSRWSTMAEDHGKDCIPQIAMDDPLPVFEKKLKLIEELSKTGQIKMVDFVYRDMSENPLQYGTLLSMRSKIEAIMHCSAVPSLGNKLCKYMNGSSRYDFTMFGFDTTSTERGHPSYFPSKIETGGKELISSYKWSNVNIETNINGNYWEAMRHEHLFCNCPVCKGLSQDEIIGRFAYNVEGDIDPQSMRTVSVLHDHYASSKEMSVIRRAVNQREIKEYSEGVENNRSDFQKTVKIGAVRKFPSNKKSSGKGVKPLDSFL